MKTAATTIDPAFDLEATNGRLPRLEPDAVLTLRPVPAATAFQDETLGHAVSLMDHVRWNVGVDQMAIVRDLGASLRADHRLIETGIRDDDAIRVRATATVRRLSAMFVKADAHGLVEYDVNTDPASLSCPDFFDHLSR